MQTQTFPKGIMILKSIATIALAVLLFYGAQFVVTFLYMIIEAVKGIFELGIDFASIDTSYAEFLGIMEIVSEKTLANALLISLISNLIVLLVLCLTYTVRHKSVFDGLSVHPINPIRYVSFALLGMALQVFSIIVVAFLPLGQILEEHQSEFEYFSTDNLFFEILSAAVITGIVEELVFRGIVTKQLKKFTHPALAVVISAMIFGLAHPTQLSMIYATVFGLVFGTIYVKYNSVVPCIICHVCFNSASSLIGRIGEDNSFIILIFFGISIPLLIYLTKSLFFKYPTTSDLLFDYKGIIKPRNAAEAEVINEMNQMKASGTISESDLINIEKRWEEAKKAKLDIAPPVENTENSADTAENKNKGDNNTDETL